jgi:hypothetical protein
MSDHYSARLGLPYLAAGQLQKHVTLNESLTRLDSLVQTQVRSRQLASPPEEAGEGDLYILAGPGVADWSGRSAGALMRRELSGWAEVAPTNGQIVHVADEAALIMRVDEAWVGLGAALGELSHLTRLGVGAAADADNPFLARLNKALWTARPSDDGGDGDLRFTFNKSQEADVLSLLFQSGWSGRAELGLVGDDDLRLKVSPDGAVWRDVFSVDRHSGNVAFTGGATRLETHVLAADAAFEIPPWARWIEAVAVGGGGGGGAGLGGASDAARFGGGGGGAGGVVSTRLPAAEMGEGAVLQAVMGAGGVGGASSGQPGQAGGWTVLSLGAQPVLTAPGGSGGAAGTASAGAGGGGATGGAGGGASSITATAGTGGWGAEADRAAGGGAGGGLNASDVARSGGGGGQGARWSIRSDGGAAAPAAAGGSGAAAERPAVSLAGGGGAGGGANALGAGHPGGAGGLHGAGGGGGGAGLAAGGPGGQGGQGAIRLTVIG